MNEHLKIFCDTAEDISDAKGSPGFKTWLQSLSPPAQKAAQEIDGTDDAMERIIAKGGKIKGFFKDFGYTLLNAAAFAGVSWAVDQLIQQIINLENRVKLAKQATTEAISVYEEERQELTELNTQLETASTRLEELYAIRDSGKWNDTLQEELVTLQLQNAELQSQASVLRQQEWGNRFAVMDALRKEVATNQTIRYVSPYADTAKVGLAADSDIGLSITEQEYTEVAIQRLTELAKLKEDNGKLTAEELQEYKDISVALSDISLKYSTWAEQASSVGAKDMSEEYLKQVQLIQDAIDETLYMQQSTITKNDEIRAMLSDSESLGAYRSELRNASVEEFLADSNKLSPAYKAVAEAAEFAGITVEAFIRRLVELGYFQGEIKAVSTSFGNLKAVLSGAKESIDSSASSLEQLKSAIGVATDWRSTTQEVSNALRTIQQLTGVKLDIKADGLQDTLQLIKAYIDGDIESFNEMASAAMKSLGVKVDPSNIKAAITQLITMLGTLTGEAQSTATALISIFSSVGAVKKVIDKDKLNADIKSGAYKGGSSQGILDKYYKYVVDDNFFNQVSDTATSSTSSGSSTDPRVEAYEAAIARLDHLRAMDLISEQEYYDGMLKAFNDHLKNKTKYQDQWWKYEEAYYAWRKKQVEESAEAEKKAAKANYDAEKDALDKKKKGYQDELNALKDKINAEKKLLDREADERSHQETVEEINDEIADYNAQIESLMLDDSAKAKAKRLDLEEQKQEAMKKLQDEQADWSKQTQENALDDQMDYWENYYGNLVDLVEESLDRIADAYDRLVSSIESSLESTLSALDTQMSQTGTGGFDFTYAKGGSKASIKETQQALMSAGYNVGSTNDDGKWGPRTEEAFIRAWQEYLRLLGADLKVDGKRGPKTKEWESKLGVVFGQRYHTGGVVGKDITADYRAITSLKPDEVPIVAQKGEVVLTADKVAQLANLVKQNKIVANAFKAFLPTARQPAMAGEAPQLSYSAVFHVNGDVDDATVRKLDKVARTAAQEVYSNAIKGLQKTGRL